MCRAARRPAVAAWTRRRTAPTAECDEGRQGDDRAGSAQEKPEEEPRGVAAGVDNGVTAAAGERWRGRCVHGVRVGKRRGFGRRVRRRRGESEHALQTTDGKRYRVCTHTQRRRIPDSFRRKNELYQGTGPASMCTKPWSVHTTLRRSMHSQCIHLMHT